MRRFRINIRDGETSGIAFGDPVRPVEIMFLHATGFNAITYQSLLEPLGTQAHVAAVDMRGHGRSKLPAKPGHMHSWNRFRDDVIQVLDQTSPNGTVLSGHSMGATVALLVAAKRPDLVKALVLAEPVLLRRSAYQWMNTPILGRFGRDTALSKGALKRRRSFPSPGEAAESLRGRGAFKTWRTPFLDDYVIDGVLRQDNGEFGLACTPEWESAVFKAHAYRPWGAIKRLRRRKGRPLIPVIILQGERDSTSQPDTDARVHAVRPDAAVNKVPGATHFLPMERPYVVRDALLLVFQATMEGSANVDYVGAVRRTIDDSVGIMG